MEAKEIWKPVVGYETFYEVSNFGRIRSLRLGKKLLLPRLWQGKYKILLYNGNGRKWHAMHRLVGIAFLDNPNGKDKITHKNSPLDNSLPNLEWYTPKGSPNSGNFKKGIGNPNTSKLTTGEVLQIKQLLSLDTSCTEIAKQFGVARTTISNIKNGNCWGWL